MKSLKEKNFSDQALLDTLFAEVKQEIQQNANNSCSYLIDFQNLCLEIGIQSFE